MYFFAECEKLIRHMLVVEPERRLSISQILAHSWMGGDGVTEPEPGGYINNDTYYIYRTIKNITLCYCLIVYS